jgi:hypothetical protein
MIYFPQSELFTTLCKIRTIKKVCKIMKINKNIDRSDRNRTCDPCLPKAVLETSNYNIISCSYVINFVENFYYFIQKNAFLARILSFCFPRFNSQAFNNSLCVYAISYHKFSTTFKRHLGGKNEPIS